ncbi:VanZ family protein [Chitinimonas sp.]|uniref:VanZ family protein n=1 Tax=Chitinimonas sp. TaxID=1934313 RepID=UPI0035B1DC0E
MQRWRLPISYLAHSARPSWLAQHFLAAWHVVILIVSWYPFSGWRHAGDSLFAFYAYPLPYYQTVFDNAINIVAYLPLGYAWAVTFRCRWHAPMLALILAVLLSALVEFVQQFLPDRVASNLDILCNGLGALAGAVVACALDRLLIVRRWLVFRQSWLAKGGLTDFGLVVLGLWLISQLNPAIPLFGVVFEPQGIPQPFVSPIANARLFLRLLECGGVLLNFTAVGLMVATLLARRSHAAFAMLAVALLAILLKVVFAGAMLKRDALMAWMNVDVLLGMAGGWLLLELLAPLKRRWRALCGLLCLLLAEGVEMAWPLNAEPTGLFALFRWHHGHLRNFSGLAQTISLFWPWLAAAYLLLLIRKDWGRDRRRVVLD